MPCGGGAEVWEGWDPFGFAQGRLFDFASRFAEANRDAPLKMTGFKGVIGTAEAATFQSSDWLGLTSAAKAGLLMIPDRSGEPLRHPKVWCKSGCMTG